MATRFFNKSKIKTFEGENLIQLEKEVNEFLALQQRVFNVRLNTDLYDGLFYYHIMVGYE